LSANKHRESDAISKSEKSSAAEKSGNARKDVSKDKSVRKQRASDLGRALRSIYDDTLRESVPDDFKDLLGKLT
jgi:Anti-sigma factor NepR